MKTFQTALTVLSLGILSMSQVFSEEPVGKQVEVRLSSGETVMMEEPPDMLGLTWNQVKGQLDGVFLISTETGDTGINQLLTSARTIGHLYTEHYEEVVRGGVDDNSLSRIEGGVAFIKGGGRGEEARLDILKAEAAIFWSAMIEDYASSKNIKAGMGGGPNNQRIFLDYYADMLTHDSREIYKSILRQIAQTDPQIITNYVSTESGERAARVEAVVSEVLRSESQQ